ncbi:hypothetical protein FGM04_22140 (plasmid) [Aeromonas veronii]|nr:hypothetical protein FGM04_22140 [Aeromonas veronii]
MTRNANGAFHQIIRSKGWTLAEVGIRWGVTERQMSRIANSGKLRDLDAAAGLPDQNVRSNGMTILKSKLHMAEHRVEAAQLKVDSLKRKHLEGSSAASSELLNNWENELSAAKAELAKLAP